MGDMQNGGPTGAPDSTAFATSFMNPDGTPTNFMNPDGNGTNPANQPAANGTCPFVKPPPNLVDMAYSAMSPPMYAADQLQMMIQAIQSTHNVKPDLTFLPGEILVALEEVMADFAHSRAIKADSAATGFFEVCSDCNAVVFERLVSCTLPGSDERSAFLAHRKLCSPTCFPAVASIVTFGSREDANDRCPLTDYAPTIYDVKCHNCCPKVAVANLFALPEECARPLVENVWGMAWQPPVQGQSSQPTTAMGKTSCTITNNIASFTACAGDPRCFASAEPGMIELENSKSNTNSVCRPNVKDALSNMTLSSGSLAQTAACCPATVTAFYKGLESMGRLNTNDAVCGSPGGAMNTPYSNAMASCQLTPPEVTAACPAPTQRGPFLFSGNCTSNVTAVLQFIASDFPPELVDQLRMDTLPSHDFFMNAFTLAIINQTLPNLQESDFIETSNNGGGLPLGTSPADASFPGGSGTPFPGGSGTPPVDGSFPGGSGTPPMDGSFPPGGTSPAGPPGGSGTPPAGGSNVPLGTSPAGPPRRRLLQNNVRTYKPRVDVNRLIHDLHDILPKNNRIFHNITRAVEAVVPNSRPYVLDVSVAEGNMISVSVLLFLKSGSIIDNFPADAFAASVKQMANITVHDGGFIADFQSRPPLPFYDSAAKFFVSGYDTASPDEKDFLGVSAANKTDFPFSASVPECAPPGYSLVQGTYTRANLGEMRNQVNFFSLADHTSIDLNGSFPLTGSCALTFRIDVPHGEGFIGLRANGATFLKSLPQQTLFLRAGVPAQEGQFDQVSNDTITFRTPENGPFSTVNYFVTVLLTKVLSDANPTGVFLAYSPVIKLDPRYPSYAFRQSFMPKIAAFRFTRPVNASLVTVHSTLGQVDIILGPIAAAGYSLADLRVPNLATSSGTTFPLPMANHNDMFFVVDKSWSPVPPRDQSNIDFFNPDFNVRAAPWAMGKRAALKTDASGNPVPFSWSLTVNVKPRFVGTNTTCMPNPRIQPISDTTIA